MSQPIVSIDKTGEPIDITQNEGFDLFFWYNKDSNYNTKVQNAVARVSLEGFGLEINSQRLEDIYFEDVSKSALLTCDPSATGKGVVINPDLVKNNVLTYGLQSAKKGEDRNAVAGSASADLEAGQIGCLRVGFKIVAGAVPGQKVKVVFDSDAKNSPSISEDKKPAQIEMEFLYAGGVGNQVSSFSSAAKIQPGKDQGQVNRETIFNNSLSQGLGLFVALVLIITVVIWFFFKQKER